MSDLYLHLRLEGSRYGGIGVLDVDRTGENVIPSRRFWHNKYRSRGHREQESSYTTYRWFSCEGETVGIMPG